ncbi:disulfide oxidoreductase [Thermoactinomyces mirandus]|nr:disulfide oxidoreductase [Thermoactinomyces mirandus]
MKKYSLYFAWLISLVATSGSLFFSDVLDYTPCTLCWWQRIFMFPLVIVLGIAAYRDDRRIVPYVLPLSVLGTGVAFYQYLLQKIPPLTQVSACEAGIPCDKEYINLFGFITFPFLSMIAFILIFVCLWVARKTAE